MTQAQHPMFEGPKEEGGQTVVAEGPGSGREDAPASGEAWVVMGTTGEYSDRSEWATKVCATEAQGQAEVERLTAVLREVAGGDGGSSPYEARKGIAKAMEAHDPGFQLDYTGTTWFLYGPVPFVGAARVHTEAAPSNGLNQNLSPPAPTSWPTREEVIYRVLRYYKLTNLIDDEGEPYPLVDAVSNPAPATIASGEEQLRFLADEVAAALFPAQPPSLPRPNPQEAEGWKPINTAPKDGTHFIGRGPAPAGGDIEARETHWCFYGKGSLSRAAFDRGEGPSGAWRWSEPIHNWSSSWNPTHWRSLDWDVADPADKWPPQGAVDALIHGQRQIDMDGVEIAVSRQALDEVLAFFVPKEPT